MPKRRRRPEVELDTSFFTDEKKSLSRDNQEIDQELFNVKAQELYGKDYKRLSLSQKINVRAKVYLRISY